MSLKYEYVGRCIEGMTIVSANGLSGFFDKSGRLVVLLRYHQVDVFSEGLAGVCIDNTWGYLNRSGQEVIPLEFDGVGVFKGGLATMLRNGKTGFIDKTGRIVRGRPGAGHAGRQDGLYRSEGHGVLERLTLI